MGRAGPRQRPDGKHARKRGRHVQACTAVIPHRSNHDDVVFSTQSNGPLQDLIRAPAGRWLPTAYVYDVRARAHRLFDGSGKIDLGQSSVLPVTEDRKQVPVASWRNPFYGAARLTEDHTGHVRAVRRHWTIANGTGHQRLMLLERSPAETRMGSVDWTVEDRNSDRAVAQGLGFQRGETGQAKLKRLGRKRACRSARRDIGRRSLVCGYLPQRLIAILTP